MTADGQRLGGLTFSPAVLDQCRAAGLTDDDLADAALDAQLWHSRLTREQRRTLKRETNWLRQQMATGRTPAPEVVARKAPNVMRLCADLDRDGI